MDSDPLSTRFAVGIAIVVGALLVSIALRAEGNEEVPAVVEGPAVDVGDLPDRALAWVHRPRGIGWSDRWIREAVFRFQPRVMARRSWPGENWVRSDLVPAAVLAAQGARYPDGWPDAELLLAKSWWESRWRPGEIGRFVVVNGRVVPGRGGEIGLMQIKPHICARYLGPGEDCADTHTNLRVAASILRELLETCGGRPRYALRAYATGAGCAPPRHGERTVIAWAQQLRERAP